MIKLIRFIETMDREDVPLNEDIWEHGVENYESGDWLVPVGQAVGTPKTSGWMEATEANALNALTENDVRMARLVWFEKGRPDARMTHKYTTVRGDATRIKTDRYDHSITTYEPGMLLTIKAAANSTENTNNKIAAGKFVLAPLGSSGAEAVVKAVCFEKPDEEHLLTFELVQ